MTFIIKDSEKHRFVITLEDGTEAGSSLYRERDGERYFFHTEIGEEFGGQGLAGTLTAEALATTAADGLSVVAICPYVRSYLEKHELDITWRKSTPADLTWIKEQLT